MYEVLGVLLSKYGTFGVLVALVVFHITLKGKVESLCKRIERLENLILSMRYKVDFLCENGKANRKNGKGFPGQK